MGTGSRPFCVLQKCSSMELHSHPMPKVLKKKKTKLTFLEGLHQSPRCPGIHYVVEVTYKLGHS